MIRIHKTHHLYDYFLNILNDMEEFIPLYNINRHSLCLNFNEKMLIEENPELIAPVFECILSGCEQYD